MEIITSRVTSRMKLFLLDQAGQNERTLSEEIRHRIERDIRENHDWGSFAVDTLNYNSCEDNKAGESLVPEDEE